MSYAIEVENLSKSIGDTVILNNISMRVRQGEIYGFLGANGAGKTSLMKALYRIMIPTSGTVILLGEKIEDKNNAVFSRIGSIIETFIRGVKMYSTQNPIAKQSQQWLVIALLDLMDEKTYTSISVKEISKKADLNRSTFYRNFNSKEELLNYHLDILMQEYIDKLLQLKDFDM